RLRRQISLLRREVGETRVSATLDKQMIAGLLAEIEDLKLKLEVANASAGRASASQETGSQASNSNGLSVDDNARHEGIRQFPYFVDQPAPSDAMVENLDLSSLSVSGNGPTSPFPSTVLGPHVPVVESPSFVPRHLGNMIRALWTKTQKFA